MYDWVSRMGLELASPIGLPILVVLTRSNASFDHCATTREHDLGAEVVVTHFRGDLSIAVVGVDGVDFIIVVGVRGQVFGGKILNRCGRSKMSRDRLIELTSLVKVDGALELLVSEVSKGRSANELAIWLEDFGGQGRSNVRGRAEVAAQDQFVIRIKWDIIPVHYPIVPAKFSDMADVSS